MTIELLFDTYEHGASVDADVRALEKMSSVVEPRAGVEERRRPHHCVVTWGDNQRGMRPFRCVIESLAVKYTMWNHDGTPLRATCTVKLKEALLMDGWRTHARQDQEKRRYVGPPLKDPGKYDPKDPDFKKKELSPEEYQMKVALKHFDMQTDEEKAADKADQAGGFPRG